MYAFSKEFFQKWLFALSALLLSLTFSAIYQASASAQSTPAVIHTSPIAPAVRYENRYLNNGQVYSIPLIDLASLTSNPDNYRNGQLTQSHIDLMNDARATGSVVISQSFEVNSSGNPTSSFSICYAENGGTIIWSSSGGAAGFNPNAGKFLCIYSETGLASQGQSGITFDLSYDYSSTPYAGGTAIFMYLAQRTSSNTQIDFDTTEAPYALRDNFVYMNGDIDVEYPEDYTGTPLVPGDPGDKDTIRPQFTYQVDNKRIRAHDYNLDLPQFTPDEGYSFEGFSVEWGLTKCEEYDPDTGICTGTELIDYSIKLQDQDYEYTVEEYGHYRLRATYMVQQCYRYPGYPDTPDHCFYVDLGTEFSNLDFTPTTKYLNIDGSSYSGDTKNEVCDVSGFCQPPEQICYAQEDFFSKMTCRMERQMNFGLLNPSINAFKGLLTNMTVPNNPECHVPLSDVQVQGHTFPLSQYSSAACGHAATFRNHFPIVPILLNFLLAMLVLYLLVQIINRLMDDKQNHIIEGVK